MTQEAGARSVVAPFAGEEIDLLGVRSRALRGESGKGAYRLETSHPATGRLVPFEISRTVGSRRMQQYLVHVGDRYLRLPLAWSRTEQRWFHLSEAFFHPDGESFHANTTLWDVNCIYCHNVKADPGWQPASPAPASVQEIGFTGLPGALDSNVQELGIACEACHGPGAQHASAMRSPFRRFKFGRTSDADPTIQNPERLSQARSAEVCGHCHGNRVPSSPEVGRDALLFGDSFDAGEELGRSWTPIQRDLQVAGHDFTERFWSDGSPRLTAYEYQGMLASPCYRNGSMTCLSCHAMHEGDPHGQLRPDRAGNEMCLQCHGEFRGAALSEHTRHAGGSTGSACIACHMPAEVYGVMSWHPSHQISTPAPAAARAHDKPDACTLCHLGRSRSWAETEVQRLWPHGAAASPRAEELPELARALLAGDVVYRTLAAERLGDTPPRGEEIDALARTVLAEALVDGYPNVRRSARNALQKLGVDAATLPLALAPLPERESARQRLSPSPAVLSAEQIAALRAGRREVSISFGE